jgi:hypothetical protein
MIGFESKLANNTVENVKGGAKSTGSGEPFIPEDELGRLYWKEIGPAVVTCGDRDFPELAYKAATICRRRFRPCDAYIISKLDERLLGETGIAFTENALYYWTEEDHFIYGILYMDIANVDYDPNGVLLTVSGESEIAMLAEKEEAPVRTIRTLPCVSDCDPCAAMNRMYFIRGMYNFIADIIDFGKEQRAAT